MMRLVRMLSCTALLCGCQSEVPKPGQRPTLDDFAYAIELEPTPGTALQTLPLPLSVYRTVTRADLGDLRVFAADEREVPHALRAPRRRRASAAPVSVPLFPLRERVIEGAPVEELSVLIERSTDGTVLELRKREPAAPSSEPAPTPATPARPSAYLLDLREVAHGSAVAALTLTFEQSARDYISDVELEVSRDLSSWSNLASNAALARLDYAGQHIERDRIDFAPTHAPFLRVRARQGQLPGRLESVHAELVAGDVEPASETLHLAGKPRRDGLSFDFDLGGLLPVRRISVELPQPNTLVQAELESRTAPNAAPERHFSGTLYRLLQHDAEVRSAPIELEPSRLRYLRLRVDARGGGLAGQAPLLQVEYVPDQLLFVARGPGPFELAYGCAGAQPGSFTPEQLHPRGDADELPSQSATAKAPRALAGDRALKPLKPAQPVKIYALWTVLIAAAGAVLWMALRMLRE